MSLIRKVEDGALTLSDGRGEVLSVRETASERGVTAELRGELRSETVHDFGDELMALATVGTDITLELSGLNYISAACMQALLDAQRKLDALGRGSLTLRGLTPEIYAEFEKTGASELLLIED